MMTNRQQRDCKQLQQFIEQHHHLNLLQKYGQVDDSASLNNVSIDSRQIADADLFIALQGERVHGLDFLASVLKRNPALIISDRALNENEQQLCQQAESKSQVWVVENLATFLGDLAAWFYQYPSQRIKVVGITGTNGKTSTAFYCAQLLDQLGQKAALMGTLGNGPLDNLQTTQNTTPDAVQVQRLLSEFAEQGVQWCVMEVSSHALCLGRVQGIEFATVAVTQVTRDHMDFHPTIEHYQNAKAKLFKDYPSRFKVLNAEDEVAINLNLQFQSTDIDPNSIWRYSASGIDASADLYFQNIDLHSAGISAEAHGQKLSRDPEELDVPLMGAFNLENVGCALSILLVNGFAWQQLKVGVAELKSVLGRMQRLAEQPTVIVDFAHTPDALQQILEAVRSHLHGDAGKLWTVFGCGGNRDRGKRPLMGRIAENLSDQIMVTSDNPRDEAPQKIVDDIAAGLHNPLKAMLQLERRAAIEQVLGLAAENDIIVIAGKGHEDYQEICGVKHPYSDIEVVEQWWVKNRA